MLYLVRHADAGDKRVWTGPDWRRPLTDAGWRQAHWLATQFDGAAIATIVSSPALRCLQTVEPLAQRHDLAVRSDARLRVDAGTGPAMDLLRTFEAPTVWCSHGELIGAMLLQLRELGAPIGGAPEWVKGSVWRLGIVAGEVVSATYHPPEG